MKELVGVGREFLGTIEDTRTTAGGNLKIGDADSAQPYEFTFGGNATYTGKTEINNATLKLTNTASLDTSSDLILGKGGILDLSDTSAGSPDTYTMNHSKLSSTDGDNDGATIKLGSNDLIISNGENNSFAGTIEGSSGSTLKVASGSLNLAGNVNLATGSDRGETEVSYGSTLSLAPAISMTSDVNVWGTLIAEGGTVNGDVAIKDNATFTNNSDAGVSKTLTVNGFTTESSSSLDFDMRAIGTGVIVKNSANIAGDLAVTAASDGIYTLFSGVDMADFSASTSVNIGGNAAKGIVWQDGDAIKMTVLTGDKYIQEWKGTENNIWGDGNGNWTDPFNSEILDANWINASGGVAVFDGVTAGTTVTVVGQQNFDTIQFNNSNITLGGTGTLLLNPEATNGPATINVLDGTVPSWMIRVLMAATTICM